jgi:hypothetical protein
MWKLLTALLTLALAGCATQLGMRNTADQRVTMFSQVVFAPDYDSRRVDYLAKWTGPVNIHLEDRDSVFVKKYKSIVNSQVGVLKKLTSLQISVVTPSNPANVTIYFDTQAGINQYVKAHARNLTAAQAALDSAGCYSEVDTGGDHQITAARIFVHAEKDAGYNLSGPNNVASETNAATRLRVKRCLTLETVRILGFRNPSDVLTPSIFNSDRYLEQTTILDLKLIRTLYQPELKAGMPRADALRLAAVHLSK